MTSARTERRNVAGRTPAPSTADQARCWVDRTCAEQGLPSKVGDEDVLRDIAVLLANGRDSGPPVRRHPGRVKDIATSDSGTDDDGVKEGGDNCSLSRGAEGVPLAS